jgi:type I restriction enzyme S subunit
MVTSATIPKGYKQTDFGVIPEDWDVKEMQSLHFDISDGNYSSSYPKSSEFVEYGIPFIRANNIKGMRIVDDDMRFISASKHQQLLKGHLKKDDVLITTRGDIGQIALVPDKHIDSNINAQLVRINTQNSVIVSRYFAYFLIQNPIQQKLKDLQSGSALKQLPVGRLVNLSIIFPKDKVEQTAIAKILSDVDALIQKLEDLIEKKKNIKQGAVQELLTGKRRLPGFRQKPVYKQTEVGAIPEDWEVTKCAELGSFYKGRGISSRDLVSDGVPCIMYGDIYVKFNIKFSNPDFRISEATAAKSSRAKTGDLFFTGSGETAEEIGKCIVYQGKEDIYIGGDIIAMTPNQDTDSLFMAYMQNSQPLLSQKANLGQGYTVVHIYIDHIKSLKIPMPPTKDEQTAIATVLSDMDAEIEALEQKLAKYKALKIGMMQQLLTGKIRVYDTRH